ncbi:alpha-amylase [Melampsora larici-populina 98AG31]|uniref:Alpha-amylase n=1 Tax=Melampsora larici-populina (strain 98AG31 / pathotype 3-4-7) TaxID=747676 RepID=F4RXG2_MELLP|nr:alpha-amylase [Melampsora larici-populina 98AG31]EGG02993.1 alpha-amylase [Melampsora larici-populina 98AG31]
MMAPPCLNLAILFVVFVLHKTVISLLRDVNVQLFQWSHVDVANECESHLGPAGYRWAQVSPPQEHIEGNAWWVDYQPVSYNLYSKRGTPDEFADMVKRCNAVGVGIIVDTVMNHMTATNVTALGTANSSYSRYSYENLYNFSDFHHCGRNGNDGVYNFTDRYEVQNCELLGLADLATETTKVRDTLGAYLEHLVSLGVSGFRLDAAKHMPASDIQAILQRVSNHESLHVSQEITIGSNEPIQPEEYVINGNVQIFQGASDLERLFKTDGMAYLVQPLAWGPAWGKGYVSSDQSTIFVTNHDLERNGGSLSPADPRYLLANVFILTWTYGQVDILSGYNFTETGDGPRQLRVECGQFGWRCDHRHPMIVGAVKIRGVSDSEPVENLITSGVNRTAYSRGSRAFVALNNIPEEWIFQSGTVIGMNEGNYTDVLGSNSTTVQVCPQGKLIGNLVVPGFSAVGIHQ